MKRVAGLPYQTVAAVFWLFAFGLPFVLVTDLFPFHRFGMFARLPPKNKGATLYRLEWKSGQDNWRAFETGNVYFDRGYFPVLAEEAFTNTEKAIQLRNKLIASLNPAPDSIRITRQGMQGRSATYLLSPGFETQ